MAIERKGSARWQGDLKSGKGTVATGSGALSDNPYGFNTRFEDSPGTNPEELIGAALASCYSMALALNIAEAGFIADDIQTHATVSLVKSDDGFAINAIRLEVEAKVAELADAKFQELADATKSGCPVSKVLNAEITLQAKLL